MTQFLFGTFFGFLIGGLMGIFLICLVTVSKISEPEEPAAPSCQNMDGACDKNCDDCEWN